MRPSKRKKNILSFLVASDSRKTIQTLYYLEFEHRASDFFMKKHGRMPSAEEKQKFNDVLMPKAEREAIQLLSDMVDQIDIESEGWYFTKKFGPIAGVLTSSLYCSLRLGYLYTMNALDSSSQPFFPTDIVLSMTAVVFMITFFISSLVSEFKN